MIDKIVERMAVAVVSDPATLFEIKELPFKAEPATE
jgi:hypothetical protein